MVLEAANEVGTVAANLTNAGSAFTFNNSTNALIVGSVAAANAAAGPATPQLFGTAVTGITTSSGDVNLKSGGLTLTNAIGASGASVRLVESAAVSQNTTTGAITAGLLSVTDSGGQVVLEATNAVPTLAASLTSPGSAFSFNDGATALTFGTVAAAAAGADPSALFPAVSNVTTSDGDINLSSGGLAINQPLNAGTGIVRLVESGAVSQLAAGTITAASLSVTDSNGTVILDDSNNVVGVLAGSSTGVFRFINASGLTVGTVAAASNTEDPSALFPVVAGVATSAGDIRIRTNTGDLTLAADVSAGSGATNAALVATTGNVTQTAGVVTASGLTVDAALAATLNGLNQVATLAGKATSSSFTFTDARSLTIGTVPLIVDVASQSGLVAGQDVALTTTSGALTVAANVTATSGSTTLTANSGAVSLTGPITVSAGQDVSVAASGAFS